MVTTEGQGQAAKTTAYDPGKRVDVLCALLEETVAEALRCTDGAFCFSSSPTTHGVTARPSVTHGALEALQLLTAAARKTGVLRTLVLAGVQLAQRLERAEWEGLSPRQQIDYGYADHARATAESVPEVHSIELRSVDPGTYELGWAPDPRTRFPRRPEVGDAVELSGRGGARGRVEIVNHGRGGAALVSPGRPGRVDFDDLVHIPFDRLRYAATLERCDGDRAAHVLWQQLVTPEEVQSPRWLGVEVCASGDGRPSVDGTDHCRECLDAHDARLAAADEEWLREAVASTTDLQGFAHTRVLLPGGEGAGWVLDPETGKRRHPAIGDRVYAADGRAMVVTGRTTGGCWVKSMRGKGSNYTPYELLQAIGYNSDPVHDQIVEWKLTHGNPVRQVLDELIASEAVYAFAAWLTTRDQAVTFGAGHDAAVAAELVSEFCERQELEQPRDRWEDRIRRPLIEAPAAITVEQQAEVARKVAKAATSDRVPQVGDLVRMVDGTTRTVEEFTDDGAFCWVRHGHKPLVDRIPLDHLQFIGDAAAGDDSAPRWLHVEERS